MSYQSPCLLVVLNGNIRFPYKVVAQELGCGYPPTCDQIKGIVMAQQVILDKCVLEDPVIRAMAQKNNLALIWVNSIAWNPRSVDEPIPLIDSLANVSGYQELADAPIFTLGHSGGAVWAWHAAYCNPQRIVGAIGLHAAPIFAPEWNPALTLDGVPVLSISGQYESWDGPHLSAETHWKWVRGAGYYLRGRYPNCLFAEIVEPGVGHFSFSRRLSVLVAMYISKAFEYRLVKESKKPQLRRLAVEDGWLVDTKLMTSSQYEPACYRGYKGDKSLAFWCFDREMALAMENFAKEDKGKKPQWLTFVVGGKPVANEWLENLPFDSVGEGMTIQVGAAYVNEVPAKIGGAGTPTTHADKEIKFKLIGGWQGGGEQLDDHHFRIKFSNAGLNRHADNIMILAYSEGDHNHAYTEQLAQVKFPVYNKEGIEQEITFKPLSNIKRGTKKLTLNATATSSLPVEFYVVHGPVSIVGNTLYIEEIPARSKMPIEVCIGAYQWGRNRAPKIQTARPVQINFLIE